MSVEGPILALDYGTVRIGMAVSDAEGKFAFPAGTLTSRGRERDLAALREVIAERRIRRIVASEGVRPRRTLRPGHPMYVPGGAR